MMIREAKKDELCRLRDDLRKKGHVALTIVALLEMEEEYCISRKIYVIDSDPNSFVFIKKIDNEISSFAIYWDAETLSNDALKLCLKSIPNWNWNEIFLVCALDSNLAIKLDEIIQEGELSSIKLIKENLWCDEYFSFEIIPENLEMIRKTLPKGFVLGELKPSHAECIVRTWKYSDQGSVSVYENFLKILPSSAVFKENDEHGNPVAWVMLYSYGHIGNMYTHPDYRKRGFCLAVLHNLCSKLKAKNISLFSQVEADNHISINFHQKIGANILGVTSWNRYVECSSLF